MKNQQSAPFIDPDPLSLASMPGSSSVVHILVSRLKRLMDQEIIHTLERHARIKVADWRILYILGARGPMSQKKLIKAIVMEQSHASRALKAMQADGLIAVARDSGDMRQWNFALSAKGRRLFHKIDPVMQARRDFLDGVLTKREIAQLQDIATRVANRTLAALQK